VDAFKNYDGDQSLKGMLRHLTEYASSAITDPTKDVTGQSMNIDDNLGAAGSPERSRVSASLERLSNRMRIAEQDSVSEDWKEILGG
jgi:hypothetical protein